MASCVGHSREYQQPQKQVDRTDLKQRLPGIQSLAMLKMEKNFIAYCEKHYPRQPYKELPPSYLIQRIEEEVKELKEAFDLTKPNHIEHMMEECADVSNLVDYLYELLLRFKNQSGKVVQ